MNILTNVFRFLAIAVAIVLVVVLIIAFSGVGRVYETNNISDYGTIKGNYDNETPKEFISSFFPEQIETYFTDTTYHYKAIKGDSYAYEMCLEFVITDTEQYHTFISEVTHNATCEAFFYAPDYREYRINNLMEIGEQEDGNRRIAPRIQIAQIGLVLFSDSEQRIAFIALGVYDGGGASTDDLSYFFDRFDVNPWQYGVLR